jgi:hypothetical protein
VSSETIETAVEPRTLRAINQTFSVLPEIGRAKGADDLYLVVSESGKEYLVDARDWSCECKDAIHRDVRCKHQRRVALQTGALDVGELEGQLSMTADELESKAVELEQQAKKLADTADELRKAQERLDAVVQ